MAKTLVISGATRGIGKAVLLHFAAQGYNAFFCARSEQDIIALNQELVKKYPQQKFIGNVVDCSSKSQIETWTDSLKSKAKSIDVLVNNAGIFRPGNIIDEADGTLESQIDANLYSAYHLTRAILPQMLEQAQGHIFNMCSIAGSKAYPGGGSYSISKYALLGFNENLRYELRDKNIKVTAIVPGAVYTDSWAASGVDPKRIMEAEDIAKMVWQCTKLSPQAVPEQIVLRPQLGDL